MKTFVRLCCLFVVVMMTSCVKRGDYIYLQDMDEKLEYPVVQKYETVIQRDDKLSIKVSCKTQRRFYSCQQHQHVSRFKS